MTAWYWLCHCCFNLRLSLFIKRALEREIWENLRRWWQILFETQPDDWYTWNLAIKHWYQIIFHFPYLDHYVCEFSTLLSPSHLSSNLSISKTTRTTISSIWQLKAKSVQSFCIKQIDSFCIHQSYCSVFFLAHGVWNF